MSGSGLIKTFADGSTIEFDQGNFDGWCVYLNKPDGSRYAPTDKYYFYIIRKLAERHGSGLLWDLFYRMYRKTTKEIDPVILDGITTFADKVAPHSIQCDIAFTCVYLGMIAENNKERTKLGSDIKFIAMYQLLIKNMPVDEVVNWSRGKGWHELRTYFEKIF